MKEIYPNLFIGSEDDYKFLSHDLDGWYIIHACKEPYHRIALGYFGKAAPKDHPEYLIAERDGHLILNLVDAQDPSFIPKEIIDKALDTINHKINNQKVLVHCNQGMSRSAVIGMLYLHSKGMLPDDFHEAERKFLELYPSYAPNNGMRMYALNNWH
jgi:predicted protein tyrosine phosphatase